MKIQIIFTYLEMMTGKEKKGTITFNNIVKDATDSNIKRFAQAVMALMNVQEFKTYKIETKEII